MFFCKECGFESAKWEGKCPACSEWNSFKEMKSESKKRSKAKSFVNLDQDKPLTFSKIESKENERYSTTFSELDEVLGGGITAGMIALIGGEPGVGKSTLLLQAAQKLAEKGKKIFYVSGEESKNQIKMRGNRLKVDSENIILFCTTNAKKIISQIQKIEPDLVIIDSIQSVAFPEIDSYAGSIKQLRECTASFTGIGKKMDIPIFLIGHVTKGGVVAGPKIIEHMVDTVLYFESESKQNYKILRTNKNRFGSTNEIGIFRMEQDGLHEVLNPSQLFLPQDENAIGKTVGAILEGTRTFFVEVQALVTPTDYGNSQRVAIGYDQKKLSVLLAVIEKTIGIKLGKYDVFVNLAGGIKVNDPALDLAVIAAIISSFQERPIAADTVLMGEVGLNGEIKNIFKKNSRINEAVKLGYERIFAPYKKGKNNIEYFSIKHLVEIFPKVYEKKD